MSIPSLKNIPGKKLQGKYILFRADFDVAVKNGKIQDDFRILANLPSLNYILQNGGRLRIISHLGRPPRGGAKEFSLRPVASYLAERLKKQIVFIENPLADKVFDRYAPVKEVLFFENIRFFPGEEKNDASFAKRLARWGDIFINEDFAGVHRKHASQVALPKFLPAFAGFNLAKEISALSKLLERPHKPLVVILGGAKLETKLPLIENFLNKGGKVLVAGALANTLLLGKGFGVGKSKVEREFLPKVKKFFDRPQLYIPSDVRVAKSLRARKSRVSSVAEIGDDETVFDIGPQTLKVFISIANTAQTIFWNGPFGYAEVPQFSAGTRSFALALKKIKAYKLVGGGDTVAYLRNCGLLKGFSHVSTGGGAMLEFLAGKKLPGIEALKRKI